MKKNWMDPTIEGIDLSATEYDSDKGSVVDGKYQNHEDCQYYESFYS